MGGKRAQGGKELRKHEMGARLTQRQAILAKCYEVRTAILMEKRIAPFPNVRFIHSCHTGRKADENTLLCFWNPWLWGG